MKKRKKLPGILLALAVLLLAASSFSWGSREAKGAEPPNAAGETGSPNPETEAPHFHTWEMIREMVRQEAVVEDVWVLDKEAWLEPREAARRHCACRCGFDGSYEQVNAHIQTYRDAWLADPTVETEAVMQQHYFDTSNMDDWIAHEAEGHWETRTVLEARDELAVTGYRCTECGAVRQLSLP